MLIGEKLISDIFIKVCGQEKYAQDIVKGDIYMKQIKYYREVENQYMGDKLASTPCITLDNFYSRHLSLSDMFYAWHNKYAKYKVDKISKEEYD